MKISEPEGSNYNFHHLVKSFDCRLRAAQTHPEPAGENTKIRAYNAAMKKINQKQLRFVKEYCIDLNGAQAAIRAGYSKNTAYSKTCAFLKRPYIKEAIAKIQSKIEKRIEISQDRVAQELALVAFADMADFITIDAGGAIKSLPLNQLKPGMSRVIKKVKEIRKILSREGEDTVLSVTFEFELHDKMKALEHLGRHLGMFKDAFNLTADLKINIIDRFEVKGK